MSFYSNNLAKNTGKVGFNTASLGFTKTRGGGVDHLAIKENLSPEQNPEMVTPNYYDPFGDQNYKI
jgi:hypothetical protein